MKDINKIKDLIDIFNRTYDEIEINQIYSQIETMLINAIMDYKIKNNINTLYETIIDFTVKNDLDEGTIGDILSENDVIKKILIREIKENKFIHLSVKTLKSDGNMFDNLFHD